jgi:crotonobetainyl-CoA:carnitine CoA-transferase CaiB-like acyl-CoA transferase
MPSRPLEGVRVVELAQNVAAPFAGLVLGQLGAQVVKVERPGSGDDTRSWRPPSAGDMSVMFSVMNAGKSSVALDIDDEHDRARLLALLDDADVVLAASRPGSLERRGLGYEDVSARNPGVVYCTLTGFGDVGPMAAEPGYDPLIQAFCGLMSVTGHEGDPEVRVGTSIVDMGSGMWLTIGVLAALRSRDRTGRGTHLTGSLLETGLAWLPYQLVGVIEADTEPGKLGSGLGMVVPYQVFETGDRPLMVAAPNDTLWQRLCAAIGRQDLADDDRFATNPQRVAARDEVVHELQTTLATHSADHWDAALREVGVPCAPVHTVAEAARHEQTEALGMLAEVPRADGTVVHLPALPLSFDGWRPRPTGPPPDLDAEGSR